MRKEIVFVGQGGQGIVMMGEIFARACSLSGKEAACISSYGPEARGSKCSSEVVISDEPIDFPGVTKIDILVAMSQIGYNAFVSKISPETQIFFDSDMVKIPDPANRVPVPAIKIAASLGSRMAANMVILGAIARGFAFKYILCEAVRKESGRFAEINIKAVEEGYKL